jgi:hypothetical protein
MLVGITGFVVTEWSTMAAIRVELSVWQSFIAAK